MSTSQLLCKYSRTLDGKHKKMATVGDRKWSFLSLPGRNSKYAFEPEDINRVSWPCRLEDNPLASPTRSVGNLVYINWPIAKCSYPTYNDIWIIGLQYHRHRVISGDLPNNFVSCAIYILQITQKHLFINNALGIACSLPNMHWYTCVTAMLLSHLHYVNPTDLPC